MMTLFMIKLKEISRRLYFSHKIVNFAIIFLALGSSPIFATQNLTSRLNDGIGLACEKEGNTNRKVYRSFFKLSKDRKVVATLDYRDDQPTLTNYHEATVLPEFIEWEKFRLNRKSLILTNLSISPRRQKCVVVKFDDLIEMAKAHLIELQKGNKI